ncbi:hypothetical protein G3I40_06170 [Streptomyces sp. SID14478]|uniref:hypothetical protein n=1 Tax=Streptomyces sp. SID14478 TaxID=2706073 RepID=UPI0013DA8E55|nr:hypothetical protein [Streptomyces sp. SID14478]NEB74819.1 hypothetical protein [Streptomyces sp. SID14478]
MGVAAVVILVGCVASALAACVVIVNRRQAGEPGAAERAAARQGETRATIGIVRAGGTN